MKKFKGSSQCYAGISLTQFGPVVGLGSRSAAITVPRSLQKTAVKLIRLSLLKKKRVTAGK